MQEYQKIQSVFKRDDKTHKFIEGEYSLPEFEYLEDNIWIWTEKVDGTNIRIDWNSGWVYQNTSTFPIDLETKVLEKVVFGGKTDNAQMPIFLLSKLQELFTIGKFRGSYPETSMCLYGEGYGARIQKGGGNYIPDGVDFILFDVLIDGWWLKRDGIEDIAGKLGIKVVPIVGRGTIAEAINAIKTGIKSTFGDFQAEGLVLKPEVELKTRAGHRIITKMKHKDF